MHFAHNVGCVLFGISWAFSQPILFSSTTSIVVQNVTRILLVLFKRYSEFNWLSLLLDVKLVFKFEALWCVAQWFEEGDLRRHPTLQDLTDFVLQKEAEYTAMDGMYVCACSVEWAV